jgi:hypothetical protein
MDTAGREQPPRTFPEDVDAVWFGNESGDVRAFAGKHGRRDV